MLVRFATSMRESVGVRFGLWPGELDIATSDSVLGDTHRQSQGRSPDAVMCPLLWHPRGRDQVVATVPLDLANLFLPPSSHRRLADELYSYTFITLQLTLSWDRSFPGRGMLGILPGFRLWVQFLDVTEAGNTKIGRGITVGRMSRLQDSQRIFFSFPTPNLTSSPQNFFS